MKWSQGVDHFAEFMNGKILTLKSLNCEHSGARTLSLFVSQPARLYNVAVRVTHLFFYISESINNLHMKACLSTRLTLHRRCGAGANKRHEPNVLNAPARNIYLLSLQSVRILVYVTVAY